MTTHTLRLGALAGRGSGQRRRGGSSRRGDLLAEIHEAVRDAIGAPLHHALTVDGPVRGTDRLPADLLPDIGLERTRR